MKNYERHKKNGLNIRLSDEVVTWIVEQAKLNRRSKSKEIEYWIIQSMNRQGKFFTPEESYNRVVAWQK